MDFKKFEENVRMDLPKSLSGTLPDISVEPAEVSSKECLILVYPFNRQIQRLP